MCVGKTWINKTEMLGNRRFHISGRNFSTQRLLNASFSQNIEGCRHSAFRKWTFSFSLIYHIFIFSRSPQMCSRHTHRNHFITSCGNSHFVRSSNVVLLVVGTFYFLFISTNGGNTLYFISVVFATNKENSHKFYVKPRNS